MKYSKIKIEGLSKLESLSLKKEFSVNEIIYKDETVKSSNNDNPSLHNEFIHVATIVVSATSFALEVLKVWLEKRKKKNSNNQKITVELPDGIIVTIEKKNIQTNNVNQLDGIADILKALGGVFKSLKS